MAKKEKKEKVVHKDVRGKVSTAAKDKGIRRTAESEGRPKKELDYYDCPFNPELRLEDFSKEFLIKLMRIWQSWYMSMVYIWWDGVSEKLGRNAGNEMMLDVWGKLAKQAMPMYIPLLGPDYKSVDDIKTLQDCERLASLPPDGGLDKVIFKYRGEWKDDNCYVVTMNSCGMLDYFEAIGAKDTAKWVCEVMEARGAAAYFVNPNVKITQIKVPPRTNPDDPNEPCCIWEYRMMDKPQR